MTSAKRILVTGAAGFVGPFVCRRLLEDGHAVRAAIRRADDRARIPQQCEAVVVPDLASPGAVERLVPGVDGVVHLAAKVHDVSYRSAGDHEAYEAANTAVTAGLARAAAEAGARAFVFASTIKVNGERTLPGRPFTAADEPQPQDAYARSKWRAELALQALPHIRSVSVRPPLVYGPGVKGNFLRLMSLVGRGVPLPLGSADNRRSLIYVANLADLLVRCLEPVQARVLLAADGPALSTRELVAALAEALGVRARLLRVPPWVLRAAGYATGRSAEVERLLGSLEVDCAETERVLGWRARFGRREALAQTAAWFAAQGGASAGR